MSIASGNIITLLPLTLLIFLVAFNKESLKLKSTKHFLYTLIITTVQSLLEIGLLINSSSPAPSSAFSFIVRGISFALAPMAGYNLMVLAIMNTPLEKYENLLKIPLIINAGLSISSIWTGLLFTISPANEYFRGPLFSLEILLNLSYLLLFIALELFRSRKYRLDDKISFTFSVFLIFGALYFQLTHDNLPIAWPTFSLCLFFYYIIYLNQNLRRDPLTNLFNRHMYERDLTAFNGKNKITIINIDVNGFKTINDSFGHYLGDKILQKAAVILQKHFDNYGYIYRIGGDEFCILLDKPLPRSIAETFISVEEDLRGEKSKLRISKLLSYGYYFYSPKECQDIYTAVEYADNYMYNFKNKYKSKIINI